MSSRIYCRFVSERWQFISNHCVSKSEGCAKVEMQLHSSQKWMESLLHVWLQCVCCFETAIWLLSQPASLSHPTQQRTLQDCICPKLLAIIVQSLFAYSLPALSLIHSLPTRSSGLHSSILIHPLAFWAISLLSVWGTTSPIKLQLELGPASSSSPTWAVILSEMKPWLQQFCVQSWPHPQTPLWWNLGLFLNMQKQARQNNLLKGELGS